LIPLASFASSLVNMAQFIHLWNENDANFIAVLGTAFVMMKQEVYDDF
jgi:hypothetical protein